MLRGLQTLTARSAVGESADQMTRFTAPTGRHPSGPSWGEAALLPRAPARVRAGSTSRSEKATQVLLLIGLAPTALPSADRLVCSRGRPRAVQERVVTRAVQMLQLANQVGLGKIFRAHTRHVVLLQPGRSSKGV